MAFNGSGTFNRLYNWVNDAASGIKIRADRMDAEMSGMATGLSNCICRDGQSTTTVAIPFAQGVKLGGGSNTLSTYAENTFTPTLTFGGSFTGGSLLAAQGNYIKVGKLVVFNLKITMGAKGSSTGTLFIGGLPFTSANIDPVWPLSIFHHMLNLSAGYTQVSGYVDKNATTISMQQTGDNISATGFTDADFTASTMVIVLSGCYMAAA